ncbi:MAG: RNA methyltransferase [Chloroflexi bacterium]|nr:RNA methyltransferase [Chloroflexota bacterium]
MTEEETFLEGARSIRAALEAQSRPIHAIYASNQRRSKDRSQIERLAAARGLSVERRPAAFIAERSRGKSHGGLLAVVGARRYVPLPSLLPMTGAAFLALLDGVEDPFNFGQCLRSLYAAGVDGVILGERDWQGATAIVARASAGASERLALARVATAGEAISFARQVGLTVACSEHSRRAASCFAADLTVPILLMLGGERRGIAAQWRAAADLSLQIPYEAPGLSLGTAAATAILAFEIRRQRQHRFSETPA